MPSLSDEPTVARAVPPAPAPLPAPALAMARRPDAAARLALLLDSSGWGAQPELMLQPGDDASSPTPSDAQVLASAVLGGAARAMSTCNSDGGNMLTAAARRAWRAAAHYTSKCGSNRGCARVGAALSECRCDALVRDELHATALTGRAKLQQRGQRSIHKYLKLSGYVELPKPCRFRGLPMC